MTQPRIRVPYSAPPYMTDYNREVERAFGSIVVTSSGGGSGTFDLDDGTATADGTFTFDDGGA